MGSCPAGASPYGCLDMAGNVLEMTADRDSVGIVLFKGGSWREHDPRLFCCTHKFFAVPGDDRGFRCVRGPR